LNFIRRNLHRLAGTALTRSGLANLPIRVGRGPLAGMRWTLFPSTAYWRGTHEPDVQRLFSQLDGPSGKSAWDLGAHYGFYSFIFARLVGTSGRVDAFEPNPLSYRKLHRHLSLNRLPQIHLHQAAVGSIQNKVDLFSYAGGDDTAAHLPFTGEDTTRAPVRWQVQMVRLDDEVTAGRLSLPDFIKLDVEGHGHHAIAGARQSIATARPWILAGIHTHEESQGIDDLLLPLGYRKLDLDGAPATYVGDTMDLVYSPPTHAPDQNA
jgi:FkbM family methyltransferase